MKAIEVVGWIGNACFFSRFLIQWIASERAGRSVSPALFWRISVLGTACLAAYTFTRAEYVLLVGALVNGAIAVRNLRLGAAQPIRRSLATKVAALALVTTLSAAFLMLPTDPSLGWLACVVVGQALWSSRFVLQWWSSERRGESHFPAAFWWISLAGNSLLLAYAIHLRDAVLIAGYSVGPCVQIRNLIILHRTPARGDVASGDSNHPASGDRGEGGPARHPA